MKRNEYLSKVSEIFDTLEQAINDFKSDAISVEEMQAIIRKADEDKPKGWMLVDEDIAECFELDESTIGQVIASEEYENEALQKDLLESIIAGVPSWKDSATHRLSARVGSGSFIPAILGEAEWNYCRRA